MYDKDCWQYRHSFIMWHMSHCTDAIAIRRHHLRISIRNRPNLNRSLRIASLLSGATSTMTFHSLTMRRMAPTYIQVRRIASLLSGAMFTTRFHSLSMKRMVSTYIQMTCEIPTCMCLTRMSAWCAREP